MRDPAAVERRVVTVLFADLVGFTPLSEWLDAEDVAAVQDAYFAAIRDTVGRHGGTLEKFIGDAAMAVFGLDRARDDDAERAVRAGLALVGAVERLGGQLGLEPGDLRVRIGIESGEVVSAESGPDQGRVTGDVVNTAARLQAAAPPSGVLLGEGAVLAAAATVELAPTQPLELKGKREPVRTALALGLRPEPRREAAMGAMRAPIVGREHEIDGLASVLQLAARGDPASIVIVAPPGAGKSRLMAEALAPVEGTVWRARARADAGASIEAIAELARAAVDGRSQDELVRGLGGDLADARAAVLLTGLDELMGVGAGGAERTDRETRFGDWIEVLDRLAGPGLVVWAIEDVHWASGDVLAFLAAAAKTRRPAGRLILATGRPSVVERLDAAIERLELDPLPAAAAGRLVHELVGDALPEELIRAIEQRSDGNPLFIEELLRSWVAAGILEADAGRWRLMRPPNAVTLPATVQAIYAGQLDDLPSAARDVARRASVAGRRFPFDALAELGITARDSGVDGLLRRDLVSGPIADDLTGPGYAYRHALLRDAGYSSLGRADRARLHVRLARWLESLGDGGHDALSDRIGGHYEAAVTSAPVLAADVDAGLSRSEAAFAAAMWLERAAGHALSLGARDAAVDLLRRSLALTEPDDGPDAGRRLTRLATTVAASGDLDEARRLAERGETIQRRLYRDLEAASGGSAAARARYAAATDIRADIESEQLHFLEARAIAEATLSELAGVHDIAWARLRLRVARAMALWDDTYDSDAVGEVLVIARRDRDPMLELEALWSLAAFTNETAAEAATRLADLGRLAAAQGQWQYVAYARRAQGISVAFDGGDPWPLLDESVEVAAAHGLREHEAWAQYVRSETGFMLGDWDRADAAARRAIELAEAFNYHRVAVRTWFALAPMAAARGDRATLEHAARYFAAHAADFPDSPYGRLLHAGIDILLERAGLGAGDDLSLDHLHASFDQDVDGATSSEALWLIASTWLDVRRSTEVEGLVAQVRAGFETLPTSDLIRGVVDIVEGRLRLATDAVEAIEAVRSGLRLVRGMRATWWVRRALRLLAAAGGATADELAEADAIDARLGVSDRTP